MQGSGGREDDDDGDGRCSQHKHDRMLLLHPSINRQIDKFRLRAKKVSETQKNRCDSQRNLYGVNVNPIETKKRDHRARQRQKPLETLKYTTGNAPTTLGSIKQKETLLKN